MQDPTVLSSTVESLILSCLKQIDIIKKQWNTENQTADLMQSSLSKLICQTINNFALFNKKRGKLV